MSRRTIVIFHRVCIYVDWIKFRKIANFPGKIHLKRKKQQQNILQSVLTMFISDPL